MTKITAKELRAILAAVPDDQPVYISQDINTDQTEIMSYSLMRYDDGSVQVCFFDTENCGMDI